MTYFIDCRRCGTSNLPDATICERCHAPLDPGIRVAMYCPVCGSASGAGSVDCRTCGFDLEKVEQIPADQRTMVCPYCKVPNPPPVQSDAAAYCISCGRETRLPGPDYSLAQFTPDKDICPSCGKIGIAVSSIHDQPDSALRHVFVPPARPDVPGTAGLSTTTPETGSDADDDLGGDRASTVERVWSSEVGAIRSIFGSSPMGASAKQIATSRRHLTWELWQAAYYCPADKIVFVRRLHSIQTWTAPEFMEEIRTGVPPGAS